MKEILNILFEHKTLPKETARRILVGIGKGEYNPGSIASFISVFLMRGISVDELSGFREALLELCLPVHFDENDTIDIVGTGGDGKNTFNISTLSCFAAAGAGLRVTKHGNYGVSSASGSSNVLERIGVKLTHDTALLNRQLNEAGICFMHAPLFHPAMKTVAPVRKELGVRTFFNLLGPLVNPARPKYMLLGTYNAEVMRLYHYLLQETDHRYIIVHSYDGYDEIALTGSFKATSRDEERIWDPVRLGLERVIGEELSGGSNAEESARLFLHILSGKGTRAQNDVVAANAGMAIHCVQPQRPLRDCVLEAREALIAGKAMNVYKKLISITDEYTR
ncbi:MAG: anthranilate phosphoribosyltransferase [Bacteroidota bacterium]